ncbi:succinate-semialdehyde dehydrogenase [Pantoea allii]|nr:succinate-semialdehyde dehydrogenase [Pantoea allii]
MITLEMGKPVAQARGEILKCANLCDWYAEHGPAMLADQPSQVPDAWQSFRPIGVILAVMPWNFPFWQVLRGAVGMLLAGNTYLLKHAPNVMGSATLMAELFDATDLPKGGFNVINVDNEGVSAAIKDDRIAAVAVTGSVRAGAAIAAQAGAALKKTVLELGGSDPFIVLADADLDEAVKSAVTGRYQNTGQVCMAAKRFIIEASIADEFEKRFVDAVKSLKIGDPLDEQTFIGPMARADLRDELDEQVKASLREGARLVLGGEKIAGQGNYYAPTILADVTNDMTAFRQELFGPVAAIAVANDAQHALEIANNSDFGLSATVWTADEEVAARMSDELEVGAVFINGNGASDPRVTIGGVKKSGYGRELSHFGVHEFCNVQTVWKNRR